MNEASKATDRPHTVRWDPEEFGRIEEAARVLGDQQHLDLTATDIIRSGTRRFVDEILSPAVDSERRAGDRRRSA